MDELRDIPVTPLAKLLVSHTLNPIIPAVMPTYYPNYAPYQIGISTAYYVDDDTASKIASLLPGASVIKITPAVVWLWGQPNTANGRLVPLANYIQLGGNGIICARFISDLASQPMSIWGLNTEQATEQCLYYIVPGAVVSPEVAAWQQTPFGSQLTLGCLPQGPPAPVLYKG